MLKRSNSVTRHAIFYGQNLVKMPRMSTFENRKFAVKECFLGQKLERSNETFCVTFKQCEMQKKGQNNLPV